MEFLIFILVALHYGIEREFSENDTNIIFYDMGASSTTASLVSFKSSTELKSKKNVTTGKHKIVICHLYY